MAAAGYWRLFVVGLVLAALSYGAWTLYDYGRYRAGFDLAEVKRERRQLEQRIDYLEDQVEQYRARATALESTKKVNAYANSAVKDTLAKIEADYQELREELQFYRTIVSPGKGREGLHIHDFTASQTTAGEYAYSLTLIHIQGTRKHHRQAHGDVTISVEGDQDGVGKTLDFANINTEKKSKIRYRFKYFARYEGKLVFPDKFVPETVNIEVHPKQKNIKGDVKKIKWPG